VGRTLLSPFSLSYLFTPHPQFNTPLQLGPACSTRPGAAQVITLSVRADDILVLASDGLSDNLWDEEILDEVVRFRRTFLASPLASGSQLPRRTLAGMLSEALCSRARNVSRRRSSMTTTETMPTISEVDDEIPFARRAREEGRAFTGGKPDGESYSARPKSTLFSRRHRHLGFSCGDLRTRR
jgi:protein phosphatase PTC7